MPGLESKGAPPVVLEGEYSDWTIYDSFQDAEMTSGLWRSTAIFNLEETEAILFGENIVKRYTVATKTLGSSYFDPYLALYWPLGLTFTRSAYGTYAVYIDQALSTVYVMKNGALVKTMTAADLGLVAGNITAINISPKGKFLAVAGYHPVTGNCMWIILEGS